MKLEEEWKIDVSNKEVLIHTPCLVENSARSIFEVRKSYNKWICCTCRIPIPDVVLFQWKLLNGK